MKEMRFAKKIYEATKKPDNLKERIEQMLEYNPKKKEQKKEYSFSWKMKVCMASCVSIMVMFVVILNTNATFAEVARNVPVIREIAKVCTVSHYQEENENENLDVRVPKVTGLHNEKVEKEINEKISEKIELLLGDVTAEEKLIPIEIDEKGYTGSIYGKTQVRIDYQIKYNQDDILSFILIKEEGLNSSSKEIYTYNINLKTGKDITLQDLLGEGYEEKVNQEILRQISKMEQENSNQRFFHKEDEDYVGEDGYFHGISEAQSFYINQKENPVIVFDKYSIAPGYMGGPEFEIKK